MKNGPEYTQLRDFKIFPSTTGFFVKNKDRLQSAGSGTFVSLGKLRGILTCAHVIEAIKHQSEVHLTIASARQVTKSFVLNVRDHCDFLKFGPSCTANGPDLGFLKLPIPFFDKIGHLVSVKSLEIGRKDAFASAEPNEQSATMVVGVIHEWMLDDQPTDKAFIPYLANVGEIAEDRIETSDNYDLFHFRPVPDEGFHSPTSYKGTSGGGLWRIYRNPNDSSEPVYRLIGVAFFQDAQKGLIICHGQTSLYVKLFDAIRQKWLDSSNH
jgi:hypothetical protein